MTTTRQQAQPVVLITGALTGIGRATAQVFAQRSARVVVSGRHQDRGATLVNELRALGADAAFIRADIRHEDEVRDLVDRTVAQFGRLDIAINNAGTDGTLGPIVEQTPESYAATFDTNVLGALLCMKHELRVMQAQGAGNIVNLSSIFGQKGFPGGALYVASKHAIIGLTKSAALEGVSFGVRVNGVAPGPVQTAMLDRVTGTEENKAAFIGAIPLGRAGDPKEIADAIAFITSDDAGFLTGQTIFLDGGMTAA